jgi:hypothetical protein
MGTLKKQTALEYFLNLTIPVTSEEIEIARKMEKEQIMDAYWHGGVYWHNEETEEQWYNKTYGVDK